MSVEVQGSCEPAFEPVRDAFIANFAAGDEIGASLSLTHRGRTVVDLWAGYADPEHTRPWARDTLVNVASATKILLTFGLLIQIDRGRIALDAPVADYWPDFAQSGKAGVTIRHVLTHTAGVPGLGPPQPSDAPPLWPVISARIAAEPHWFEGRRQVCYHVGTYGFILAELIRRTDGRHYKDFCVQEIISKCGADFHLGITSDTDFRRLAEPKFPELMNDVSQSDILRRTLASFAPAPDRRTAISAGNPSGGGFTHGRGLARICAILANGGELDGVRYLSPELVSQVGQSHFQGVCPFFGLINWGLGFSRSSENFHLPSAEAYQWGGAGGSRGFIDPVAQVSFGYAPNNLIASHGGDDGEDVRHLRFNAALAPILAALSSLPGAPNAGH